MTPTDVATGWIAASSSAPSTSVVFSYFLFTVSSRSVSAAEQSICEANPGVEVRYAGYFGLIRGWLTLWSSVITEAVRGTSG